MMRPCGILDPVTNLRSRWTVREMYTLYGVILQRAGGARISRLCMRTIR
ncbi:MAG: hypothetical protein ACTSYB_06395 [Candidatus Helarchaeota archaeon]